MTHTECSKVPPGCPHKKSGHAFWYSPRIPYALPWTAYWQTGMATWVLVVNSNCAKTKTARCFKAGLDSPWMRTWMEFDIIDFAAQMPSSWNKFNFSANLQWEHHRLTLNFASHLKSRAVWTGPECVHYGFLNIQITFCTLSWARHKGIFILFNWRKKIKRLYFNFYCVTG